jgi:hypothetical protein
MPSAALALLWPAAPLYSPRHAAHVAVAVVLPTSAACMLAGELTACNSLLWPCGAHEPSARPTAAQALARLQDMLAGVKRGELS